MRISARYHDRPARSFLEKLRRYSINVSPYWRVGLIKYRQFLKQVFEQEGTPEKWPPLKPSTIARRRRGRNRGPGLRIRILRDTGQLFQSAMNDSGAGYLEITAKTMTVGSKLPYAKFHHDGTRNMPRRRFFQINNQTLAAMGEAMNRAALQDAQR